MIEVREYKKGDAYKVGKLRQYFENDTTAKDRSDSHINNPYAYLKTVCDGDVVLAVLGGTLFWPGTMEIWSLTSDGVAKYPVSYVKIGRSLLDQYQERLNITRFQAVCMSGNPKLEKWFELLGFEKESLMKKYGPGGKDFYMYARIR